MRPDKIMFYLPAQSGDDQPVEYTPVTLREFINFGVILMLIGPVLYIITAIISGGKPF